MTALKKYGLAAAVGAGLAYLFDPDRGRSRRARLTDQTKAKLRREARAVERQAHLQRGRMGGLVHKATHRAASPPENDQVLVDKVKSEVLGRRPDIAGRVNIDAAKGVVTLRGEVDDSIAIIDLETNVRRVNGVDEVVNLLHPPGEPAPNKAEALHTTS